MTRQWHGGKGDRRRKHANDDRYRQGWDRIFGNDEESVNDTKEEDKERR